MAGKRTDKVNELLKIRLARIVAKEVEFPKETVVAVTRVNTSGDLKKATAYISIFPDSQRGSCLRMLQKRKSHIQHLLDQELKMYTVPRIQYTIDAQGNEKDSEQEIDELFKTLE